MNTPCIFFVVLTMCASSLLTAQDRGAGSDLSVTASDAHSLLVSYGGKVRLSGGRPGFQMNTPEVSALTDSRGVFTFETNSRPVRVSAVLADQFPVVSFFLSPNGAQPDTGTQFLGLFFEEITDFDGGVALWRYKPWNSWTKPIAVSAAGEIPDWDVQFFYWRYSDGVYGAAMPLSGRGYRTTLGQEGGRFGSKSVCYVNGTKRDTIPQMAIGFGKDPYKLFAKLFEAGMTQMGRGENLRTHKQFPPILERIGWCTWNASDLGKNLNEQLLLKAAQSFAKGNFPIGWFLVDDGWLDQTGGKLNSFIPDKKRFPRGFQSVIRTLKKTYHLHDVGVWHTLNGYWQGINPSSTLGKKYRTDLVRWEEKVRPDREESDMRSCSFISPNSKYLGGFYSDFHQALRDQGFSFVKVDNQLIVERMSPGNFPIWTGAERYHAALNKSVATVFNNTIINCMDMTIDAWANFGTTAVGRTSEDYFPYDPAETYDLQKGNAAAHVLQAIYNSVYFSQLVYPDFDEFQSHHPQAAFHAVARALNNGPIYITDTVGGQNFDVLFPLVYSDGTIIRSDAPLLPTEDCLFQIQAARPFKAFSTAGGIGLLGVWNCADADRVKGDLKPSDVHGIAGENFAVYEYFSKELTLCDRDDDIDVSLDRLACRLYYVVPLVNGKGVIGLVNKYNAPATVRQTSISAMAIRATVHEGGDFAAVSTGPPTVVRVDGNEVPFTYSDNLIRVSIAPGTGHAGREVFIGFE